MGLALCTLAIAGLAGCFSDDEDSTPAAMEPGPLPTLDGIRFAASQVLGTMTLGAEPSVAVAPDGTAYVTTPIALWRSDDGGHTWIDLGAPFCSFGLPTCPGLEQSAPEDLQGGGDADIWVTPDGRLHWLGLFGEAGAVSYQVSEDRGETWSPAVDLAEGDDADRQWITGRADGTLFASWRNFPSQGDSSIVVRASFDGGNSWTDAVSGSEDTRFGGVAVDPASNAIAYAYDMGGELHVARSMDNGTTWQDAIAWTNEFQGQVFPVAAFDAAGNLYVAATQDPDGAFGTNLATNRPLEQPVLLLAVSKDKGATWSEPRQINPDGTTAWFPWLAAGAEGRVIAVWYQNDRGLPRQATDDVYVMSGISLDADDEDATWAVTRVKDTPIHFGPECRENPGCTRSLLDFFEVAIHPAGYPIVTWAEDLYPLPRVDVAVTVMEAGPDLLG